MLRALSVVLLVSAGAMAQQQTQKPEHMLPLPPPESPLPPLDLSLLKDTSLCVSPFVKETGGNESDRQYLDAIQKTFFDVARLSPLLKDAVLLGHSALCDPHDAACFSRYGKEARCHNVLVGSSAAKGNGFVLSVRIFEVDNKQLMPNSQVDQVLETDRQGDVQAWAEGQACRALQVKCGGRLLVDADRTDMEIYVDGRLVRRAGVAPEQIAIEPGVHGVRVAVGQRTSLEKKVPVRRNSASQTVYARQTARGGLPILLASEMKFGERPAPSADVEQGKWTRPVGYTLAAAAAVALGLGIFEGQHSRSLIDQAQSNYRTNQAYLSGDVAKMNAAHSAATAANALLVASALLAASGATLVFAF